MLKGNDFGNDVEDVRSERANLMSENIDSMAATIGVAGPKARRASPLSAGADLSKSSAGIARPLFSNL